MAVSRLSGMSFLEPPHNKREVHTEDCKNVNLFFQKGIALLNVWVDYWLDRLLWYLSDMVWRFLLGYLWWKPKQVRPDHCIGYKLTKRIRKKAVVSLSVMWVPLVKERRPELSLTLINVYFVSLWYASTGEAFFVCFLSSSEFFGILPLLTACHLESAWEASWLQSSLRWDTPYGD